MNERTNSTPRQELTGLRGWLLIFVVTLFLALLESLILLYAVRQHGTDFESYLAWSHVVIGGLGLWAALLLIGQRIRRSVWAARAFLAMNFGWGVLTSMMAEDIVPSPTMFQLRSEMDSSGVQAFIYSIFWLIYLAASRRVKATYPPGPKTGVAP